jgi:hypothetical protein
VEVAAHCPRAVDLVHFHHVEANWIGHGREEGFEDQQTFLSLA